MELSLLCTVLAATLSIHGDKSQFFQYDSISLMCAAKTSGWTLRKINSSKTFPSCDGNCTLLDAMPSDTGIYMCQSEHGRCSNTVSITVTAGLVILEMPSTPVTAGNEVTLRCVYKNEYSTTRSSAFKAKFYKDGAFIGKQPTGEMILASVSTSNTGFYGCEHPEHGRSPVSWLTVTGPVPTKRPPVVIMSLPRLVCTVLMVVLFSTTFLLCVYVHCKWIKGRRNDRTDTY